MQLNPDIILSVSGIVVSQPLSQSVGHGFESQRKCLNFFFYNYISLFFWFCGLSFIILFFIRYFKYEGVIFIVK